MPQPKTKDIIRKAIHKGSFSKLSVDTQVEEAVDWSVEAIADLLLGLPELQRVVEPSFIYEPELASEAEQVNNKIEKIRQAIARALGVNEPR